MSPEFPIRIIFDDGEVVELATPEDLLAEIDTLDSADARVWVRDANDRTVKLRMLHGSIEVFEI